MPAMAMAALLPEALLGLRARITSAPAHATHATAHTKARARVRKPRAPQMPCPKKKIREQNMMPKPMLDVAIPR